MRELLDTLAQQMAERDAERGKRIQALRLARGFRSAEAAAQAVHVSHRTFQNWEAGKTIDEGNIPKVAEVLQVPEDVLRSKPLEVPDLVRNDSLRTQIDRMEAELAATRVELGEALTRLEEMQKTLARIERSAASGSRSRKAK